MVSYVLENTFNSILNFSVQETASKSVDDRKIIISKNKDCIDLGLVESAVKKLLSLRHVIASLDSYRFYSCSMLFIYEGDSIISSQPAKQLDFAKSATVRESGDITQEHNNDVTIPVDLISPDIVSHSGQTILSPPFSSKLPNTLQSEALLQTSRSSALEMGNIDLPKGRSLGSLPVSGGGDTTKVPISCTSKENLRDKKGGVKTPPRSPEIASSVFRPEASSVCTGSGVDVRLVDFAHFCSQDPVVHPGPDSGFLYGLDKLIELFQAMLQ